jgi:hypothetical protein
MMTTTILYDATAARKPVRSGRRFAAGLLVYVLSSGRVDHLASDEAEYAELVADRERARRDFDQHLEERALHAARMDRVGRGPIF